LSSDRLKGHAPNGQSLLLPGANGWFGSACAVLYLSQIGRERTLDC